MLQLTNITLRVSGRPLLEDASLTVPAGHKVSLVGRNGTGKTTLLRAIAGEIGLDGGSIDIPPRLRVGLTRQEAPAGPQSLIDTVLAADTERTALLAEAETATDPHRIAEIHTRLADIGAHSAEARAGTILYGLGFDGDAQRRPCADFSGGWRMRVALAGLLFSQPDLLLLDEPTNHLDLEATLWLQSYLRTYPHTVLLVSHDRELLNAVPQATVHLDQNKLTLYSGGYDRFERTRREQLERQQAMAVRQEAQRAHLQSFVDRFRYKASKAKQAQSRIKMLERMEPIASVVEAHTISFNFPSPEPLAPPLMVMDKVSVGYEERAVLRGLNLRIDEEDRIALLGANGNGKSTLAKLIAGRLEAMSGDLRKSGKLRIGYFAQHQAEEFDLSLTVLAQARRWMPEANEEKVRSHLGRFGFGQDRAGTSVGNLSGGEKARLLFAMISREAPHILILDEPTNHLDVDSRQALIVALNEFQGTVILVSHDPHLIEATADRLWLVAGGEAKPFDGDMDDYRTWLLERAREQRNGGERSSDDGSANRKDQRRAAAELRQQLAPLKKKVDAAEKRVEKLSVEKAGIEQKLADPALYSGPAEKVTALQKSLADTVRLLEAAETDWLEAQEAYDSAYAAAG
jgi:ATP-binding cassette subfamily F protein 3